MSDDPSRDSYTGPMPGLSHLRLAKAEPSILDRIRSTWVGTLGVAAIFAAGACGATYYFTAMAGKADAAQMTALEVRVRRLEESSAAQDAHLTDALVLMADLKTDVRTASAMAGHVLPPPPIRPHTIPAAVP